jgi:hypothetical protein
VSQEKLTLERGRWYALTMYPGYGDKPYQSPVRVEEIKPLGSGLIEIEHWNVGYAEGVQVMKKTFRVHRRGASHMVLDEFQVPARTVIIETLTGDWIRSRVPGFVDWFAQQHG